MGVLSGGKLSPRLFVVSLSRTWEVEKEHRDVFPGWERNKGMRYKMSSLAERFKYKGMSYTVSGILNVDRPVIYCTVHS